MASSAIKIIAQNKKAYYDYFILKNFEAGIVLTGTEIKSIRNNRVNLRDSFIRIFNGEAFIYNMHISKYEQGNRFNHEPTRTRKLLLNQAEIIKLSNEIALDGHSVVPISLYLKNGLAKLEIATAKGKKTHDKRQSLKEKDIQRQINKERY